MVFLFDSLCLYNPVNYALVVCKNVYGKCRTEAGAFDIPCFAPPRNAMKNKKKRNIPRSEGARSLEVLAGEMSDDFKNILTVILGACTLIDMNAAAGSELLKCVSLIRASAEHAAALSDRMVQLSGLSSGSGRRKVGREISLESNMTTAGLKRGNC